MQRPRRMTLRSARAWVSALVLLLAAPGSGGAGALCATSLVPSDAHAASNKSRAMIFVKALSYEQRMADTKGSSVGIAIVHAKGNPASVAGGQQWLADFAALANVQVHDVPMELSLVEFDAARLREVIRAKQIDVVLACEGIPVAWVSAMTRELQVLSASDSPAGVDQGLSLGVFIVEGKPRIVINMLAAKAEGAKFSGKLLQVAEVR